MRKNILIIVAIFTICNTCNAQLWCSPNAEWYYGISWLTGNGYLKINYTGTTVTINNKVCNQLDCTDNLFYYNSNTVLTFTNTYYTYEKDSIVYLYSPTYNFFDTLYNYKANIGDSWLYPFYSQDTSLTSCQRYKVQVTDTGHQVIQGVNLKWLKLNNNETLFERIGVLKKYAMPYFRDCGFSDGPITGALRCFSDIQISNYKNYAGNCNYIYNPNSVEELATSSMLKVFPNPATNKIVLKINNDLMYEPIEVCIYNTIGVLIQKSIITASEINVEGITNGAYYINFKSRNYNFYEKFIINKP